MWYRGGAEAAVAARGAATDRSTWGRRARGLGARLGAGLALGLCCGCSESSPGGGTGGAAGGAAGGAGGAATTTTTTTTGPYCGCYVGEGGCSSSEMDRACGPDCCGPADVSACVVKDGAPLCVGLSDECQSNPSCECVLGQLEGATECLWIG